MTLGSRRPLPLPRHARSRPDHPALLIDGVPVTYAALAAEVDDTARRLAGLGLVAGDRLAACLPNGRPFAVLLHAAARLGAILVPLNMRLTPAELAGQLIDSGSILAVGDGGHRAGSGDPSAPVGPIAPQWPGQWVDWATLATGTAVDVPLVAEVDLADPATIVYTSGTTGRPKGVVLTHGNHLWSAFASAQRLGALPGDRWLVPLPLFHVGGLAVLARGALFGTTAEVHGRFDPARVADTLVSGTVTLASLVPTMLARVLDVWAGRPVPPAFRAVLLGGGPIPVELLRRAAGAGIPVAPTYGLTEACSQVATAVPALAWPNDDVGAEPLAFTTVRVVGDDGAPLSPGAVGEIQVRGPTVMARYWNDGDGTTSALADGWLHTGDAGWLDERGWLYVADRRDDLIVSGGENVYPGEVEAVLDAHPGVVESCVVGMPDDTWGHVVTAVVVRAPGDVRADTLIAHVRGQVAGYKVPRRVLWADGLPRTAAGKLRRGEVRAGVVASAFTADQKGA
jgi:o-succinylbenzoate---CoA ligase